MAVFREKMVDFVKKLHASGIDLVDEPLSDEEAETFADELLSGEEHSVRRVFYYALFNELMGVSKKDVSRAPYPLESYMNQRSAKNVLPTLEKMRGCGIPDEDISRVIGHFERWARYGSLFGFVELLESSWIGLDRLLDELDMTFEDTDERHEFLDSLGVDWGLASFDTEGDHKGYIPISHESIGPDSFFEEY